MLSWAQREERRARQDRQRVILASKYGVPDDVAKKWIKLYPFDDVCRWCDMLHGEGGRWVEIDYGVNCAAGRLVGWYYLICPVSARLEYRSWSF